MEEKRAQPRARALKAARIILPGGYSTFDCMVRNLSAGGAKLVMETTVGVPDEFSLRFEDGSIRPCQAKWRNAKELGVAFVATNAA
ncbi:PilZ domain-containing protein [Rhizobium cremeum]|uniref:PilZ domain-containing protein n=1 Tax=Rhizobium cremeum TaxID=2813827 RepID=UPI000DDC0DC2|nr:PilZ domain-containing protein [Rhizobium cremeum]MCJ7996617.1 PilZ domain-containing protein [Rhizobium cremeum]MCJ7999341.1 PilZ domain-containing protein [Rhizobium cremeum]